MIILIIIIKINIAMLINIIIAKFYLFKIEEITIINEILIITYEYLHQEILFAIIIITSLLDNIVETNSFNKAIKKVLHF